VPSGRYTRSVRVSHAWDGYDPKDQVGNSYTFGLWTTKSKAPSTIGAISFAVQDENGADVQDGGISFQYDTIRAACVISIPSRLVPLSSKASKKYLVIRLAGFD
jgi:hypothetical protein